MTQGHSPKFIQEMKDKLLLEKKELEAMLGREANTQQGDFVAKFEEYGRNAEENVTEVADYVAKQAAVDAGETRLHEVTKALGHIAEGTYGVTDKGELIPEDRLRANPAAATLVKHEKS